MIASNVTVTANYEKAVSYATITKITEEWGLQGGSGSGTINNTSATLSLNGNNQQYGGTNWYFDVNITVPEAANKITFTLANSSSSTTDLNARVSVNGYTMSSCTGGEIENSKVSVDTIAANGSQVVSITTSSNMSGTVHLCIYPVKSDVNNNYVGSFTISEIYFG